MILTVLEAAGDATHPPKACRNVPMILVPEQGTPNIHLAAQQQQKMNWMNTPCIAADCMLWRWADANQSYVAHPTRLGYCGAGGAPIALMFGEAHRVVDNDIGAPTLAVVK